MKTESMLVALLGGVFFTFVFLSLGQASSNDFSISIKPDYQLIFAGEADSFEITIKNEGGSAETYTLEIFDNSGWDLKLQENKLVDVAPGEQRITTFEVTVPKDAEIGFEDVITVTVLSSRGDSKSETCRVGVLRGDVIDWDYVTTGVGLVVVVFIIVLVLWKGGI